MSHTFSVNNLTVSRDGSSLVKDVSLQIRSGEIHLLMGQNGSGKSTLLNAVAGNPLYEVEGGSLVFDGDDITPFSPEERSRKGLFLGFQHPVEIPGVTMGVCMRAAANARRSDEDRVAPVAFAKQIQQAAREIGVDSSFISRDVNVGFSGGEKKRSEILQMMVLNPAIAMLDEIDSGLDADALAAVSSLISSLALRGVGFILVSHNERILDHITPDAVHVMQEGALVRSGDASLAREIMKNGYSSLLND